MNGSMFCTPDKMHHGRGMPPAKSAGLGRPLFRLVVALCAILFSAQAMGENADITEQFLTLASQNRWKEALPIVEDIVHRAPTIATSWRNYGVCLDELGRHAEAAKAFQRAYQLQPSDLGLQYRVLRSFALANDVAGFIAFADEEAKSTPEIFQLIADAAEFPEFRAIIATPSYQKALRKNRH